MRTGDGRAEEREKLRHGGLAVVLLFIFCFGALKMGSIYGFLIFPDEFAYWAHAAYAAGYDWSDILSLGSYFSYGYGVILLPIFLLCKDAVLAYRIAVGLNYVFLIAAYVLLTCTLRKMIPDKKMPVPLFAAITIMVPWNLFYAQMTMTETLLVCLNITVGYLLFCYLDNNRLSTLILLMLTLMYMYTVHMRTVGILLSAVIVLAMHIALRGEKKGHLLVIIGIAVPLLLAATYMKDYTIAHAYGGIDPTLAADNDYSGQLVKLRYICTKEGFYDLAVTALGGILYLGLATFGMFYWGIYALLRETLQLIRICRDKCLKPEKMSGEKADAREQARAEMALYVLLTVVIQIMIASIYLLQRGEVDDYTYGRYSEVIVPFVMAVRFAALWKARKRTALAVTGALAMAHAVVVLLVTRQIVYTGSEQYLGYFMVGISYLYKETTYTVGRFYAGAWVLCEFLTLFVVALTFLCRRRRGRQYLVVLLAVLELALAVHADNLYLVPFKNAAFRDIRVVDRIVSAGGRDRKVFYMDDGRQAYIGILQFMARDMDIQVMERKEEPEDYGQRITGEDILVFAFDDPYAWEWTEKYSHEDTYGHFTILYND